MWDGPPRSQIMMTDLVRRTVAGAAAWARSTSAIVSPATANPPTRSTSRREEGLPRMLSIVASIFRITTKAQRSHNGHKGRKKETGKRKKEKQNGYAFSLRALCVIFVPLW